MTGLRAGSLKQPPRSVPPVVLDAASALFAVLPLCLTAHLPLYDLPNHTAMLHVLLDGAAHKPLSDIYEVHWRFIPNMGFQVFGWLVSPLFSAQHSARLFCIFTVLLLCAGTRALSLALNGSSSNLRLYRLAPLFVWGAPMQYGFVGYCLGVALTLFALALYSGPHLHTPIKRIVVFSIACLILLGIHLMAFGFFLSAVAGFEIAAATKQRGTIRIGVSRFFYRVVQCVLVTLPAFAVLLLSSPMESNAAPGFHTPSIEGYSLFFKAESIAAITWFTMPSVEVPLLVSVVACAGFARLAGIIRMNWLASGMVAALSIVWLVLPREIAGSFYVDYRVPWVICFVALAGIEPASMNSSRLARCVVTGLMVCLVATRVMSICWHWLYCEPELAAIDTAVSKLPEGSSLWVVEGEKAGKMMKSPPLEHTAAYFIVNRNGFESGAFAGAAGQLVSLKSAYRPLYRLGIAHDLLRLPNGYDAVLVLFPLLVKRAPNLDLRTIASGANFELLQRSSPPAGDMGNGAPVAPGSRPPPR